MRYEVVLLTDLGPYHECLYHPFRTRDVVERIAVIFRNYTPLLQERMWGLPRGYTVVRRMDVTPSLKRQDYVLIRWP